MGLGWWRCGAGCASLLGRVWKRLALGGPGYCYMADITVYRENGALDSEGKVKIRRLSTSKGSGSYWNMGYASLGNCK